MFTYHHHPRLATSWEGHNTLRGGITHQEGTWCIKEGHDMLRRVWPNPLRGGYNRWEGDWDHNDMGRKTWPMCQDGDMMGGEEWQQVGPQCIERGDMTCGEGNMTCPEGNMIQCGGRETWCIQRIYNMWRGGYDVQGGKYNTLRGKYKTLRGGYDMSRTSTTPWEGELFYLYYLFFSFFKWG